MNGKELFKRIRENTMQTSWFFYNKIIPVDLVERTNYVDCRFINEDALWGLAINENVRRIKSATNPDVTLIPKVAEDGLTKSQNFHNRYRNEHGSYEINVKRDSTNPENVYVTLTTEYLKDTIYLRSKMLTGEPNSVELTYVSNGLIIDKLFIDEHGQKYVSSGNVFKFKPKEQNLTEKIENAIEDLEK